MYIELFYMLFLIPNLIYGGYRKIRKGKTTDIHRLLGRAKEAEKIKPEFLKMSSGFPKFVELKGRRT